MKKKFKVANVGTQKLAGELYLHTMVAEDGECWQVTRSRIIDAWDVGQIVEPDLQLMAMPHGNDPEGDRVMIPIWAELGCETQVCFELNHRYLAVKQTWGKDVADLLLG